MFSEAVSFSTLKMSSQVTKLASGFEFITSFKAGSSSKSELGCQFKKGHESFTRFEFSYLFQILNWLQILGR
jgi:hypothetical protein